MPVPGRLVAYVRVNLDINEMVKIYEKDKQVLYKSVTFDGRQFLSLDVTGITTITIQEISFMS